MKVSDESITTLFTSSIDKLIPSRFIRAEKIKFLKDVSTSFTLSAKSNSPSVFVENKIVSGRFSVERNIVHSNYSTINVSFTVKPESSVASNTT